MHGHAVSCSCIFLINDAAEGRDVKLLAGQLVEMPDRTVMIFYHFHLKVPWSHREDIGMLD